MTPDTRCCDTCYCQTAKIIDTNHDKTSHSPYWKSCCMQSNCPCHTHAPLNTCECEFPSPVEPGCKCVSCVVYGGDCLVCRKPIPPSSKNDMCCIQCHADEPQIGTGYPDKKIEWCAVGGNCECHKEEEMCVCFESHKVADVNRDSCACCINKHNSVPTPPEKNRELIEKEGYCDEMPVHVQHISNGGCVNCGHAIRVPKPQQIEKESWEAELQFGIMEDYIREAEMSHGLRNGMDAAYYETMRGYFEKLKSFIAKVAEEAEEKGRNDEREEIIKLARGEYRLTDNCLCEDDGMHYFCDRSFNQGLSDIITAISARSRKDGEDSSRG